MVGSSAELFNEELLHRGVSRLFVRLLIELVPFFGFPTSPFSQLVQSKENARLSFLSD